MTKSPAVPTVVAFDIGGTSVKSLTVTRDAVLDVHSTPTRADQGPEAALEAVLDEIDTTLAALGDGYEAVGVGVASPGLVDETKGLSRHSENLGWRDVPLKSLVQQRTGLPVGFGHDVRAGGLAERYLGAGRGAAHQAYLSLGTGIACALVLQGVSIVADGYCGEVGHGGSGASGDGEPCACGGRGCAETYASAAGMVRRYRRLTGRSLSGARDLVALVDAGDETARTVWDEAIEALAGITSDIVRVTGVSRVVVGGGLSLAGERLIQALTAGTAQQLTIHRRPEIVPAALAGVSGSWGTALLGWAAAGYDLDDIAAGYLEKGPSALIREVNR